MDENGALLYVAILAALFGLIGVAVGNSKGRPAAGFAYGALLGPIGLIIAAMMPKSAAMVERETRERLALEARVRAGLDTGTPRDASLRNAGILAGVLLVMAGVAWWYMDASGGL